MNGTLARWATGAIWLLPVYGALTLVATVTQQPDPATDFRAWSLYVTTPRFYASHLVASILGLAIGTLGIAGLGVVLSRGSRPRAALVAVALHVVGAAFVLGLFGVAAFVQPAIGGAFLDGQTAAGGWYDAVFDSVRTLAPAAVGLLVFSAASVVMAWSLAAHRAVPRWVVASFAASAPFIGFLGLLVDVLQPIGSVLLMVSGSLLALRLRGTARSSPASPPSQSRARSARR